ncbi:MAG: response regulator [Deltaproteobacteria bacterium]|nr:response regulator [Deltaproteobacteria bacterium]
MNSQPPASNGRQSILIVDDEILNVKVVSLSLKNLGVNIFKAVNGEDALEIIKTRKIDLVLLDLMMPVCNGFEVLEKMQEIPGHELVSVIILTAIMEDDQKIKALEMGAADYLIKPFQKRELLARVKLHLSLRKYQKQLNNYAENLETKVKERTIALRETQDVIAFCLARLAESRDPETGDHLERMSRYSQILAQKLLGIDGFILDSSFPKTLKKVAVLHDIGKVGIPDNILLKPGRLTKEEFEVMKTHTILGGQTLQDAMNELNNPGDYLQIACNVAFYHHEKWNGKGYPKGLKGLDIPLCARIVALADVYDALRSKRVYKPGFSHEKAKSIIVEEKGQHFQPEVVDAFLELEEQFIDVARRFKPENT